MLQTSREVARNDWIPAHAAGRAIAARGAPLLRQFSAKGRRAGKNPPSGGERSIGIRASLFRASDPSSPVGHDQLNASAAASGCCRGFLIDRYGHSLECECGTVGRYAVHDHPFRSLGRAPGCAVLARPVRVRYRGQEHSSDRLDPSSS